MIFGVKVLPATGAGCGECEVEMAGQTQILALPFRADQGRFKLMRGELLEQAVLADDADQSPGRVDHRDVAQVVAGHCLQRGADRLVEVDIAQGQTHALIKPDRLWFGVLIEQAWNISFGQDADWLAVVADNQVIHPIGEHVGDAIGQ